MRHGSSARGGFGDFAAGGKLTWRASRPFEAGSGCCIGASMSAVGGTHAAVPRVTVLHRDDKGRNE